MKRIILLLNLLVLSAGLIYAQSGTISIDSITVKAGEQIINPEPVNFPFKYGSWSPKITMVNEGGTVIQASFRLNSPRTGRSEIKNSSVELNVKYEVGHAGTKRVKEAEHIYYLDAERAFNSEETFSFKPDKYTVKVVRLSFRAKISE